MKAAKEHGGRRSSKGRRDESLAAKRRAEISQLYHVEELSPSEIALKLNIDHKTVTRHIAVIDSEHDRASVEWRRLWKKKQIRRIERDRALLMRTLEMATRNRKTTRTERAMNDKGEPMPGGKATVISEEPDGSVVAKLMGEIDKRDKELNKLLGLYPKDGGAAEGGDPFDELDDVGGTGSSTVLRIRVSRDAARPR